LEVRVTSSLLNRMKQVGYSGWLGSPAPADYGMVGAAGLTAYAKVAVTTSDTDKTILNKVLAYAEGQYADPSFDNVIETVQASFTAALENAREISANRAATQQQIDSAWQILMTEIHKLGFVRGDKTALGQLIETAEEFAQIIDRYTPATAQPFTTALEAAKETYSDGDAMQGEVTEAESSLLQAMLDLRYRADKSVLKQVLADAASRDLTAYTTESVTAFHAASDAAKTVYDNSDATQQEVDDAASALTEAIGNLERTELSTQQPAVQGDKEATTQSGNAKTGEAIPIAAVIVLTLAGAGFFLSKKKR
ncbi:MAG: FIVAR domain-containing protein, partial [Massilioclostridium sp.]|nr:FIVAR domain-containing protein [Massilioclostridium sp.]